MAAPASHACPRPFMLPCPHTGLACPFDTCRAAVTSGCAAADKIPENNKGGVGDWQHGGGAARAHRGARLLAAVGGSALHRQRGCEDACRCISRAANCWSCPRIHTTCLHVCPRPLVPLSDPHLLPPCLACLRSPPRCCALWLARPCHPPCGTCCSVFVDATCFLGRPTPAVLPFGPPPLTAGPSPANACMPRAAGQNQVVFVAGLGRRECRTKTNS